MNTTNQAPDRQAIKDELTNLVMPDTRQPGYVAPRANQTAGTGIAEQTTHEAETGCSRRMPCEACDEQTRRLWYGDAYSDESDDE